MAKITPKDHMWLLNKAWTSGIDREVTKKFLFLSMLKLLKAYTDAGRSDEFVRGFACAIKGVDKILDETVTFKEVAEKWEDPNA